MDFRVFVLNPSTNQILIFGTAYSDVQIGTVVRDAKGLCFAKSSFF